MMNESTSQLLSASATQHATQLNSHISLEEKWNSEAGQFFRSLTVPIKDNPRISPKTVAEILYQLGQHSTDSGFNFSIAAHLLAAVIPIGGHGTNSVHQNCLENVGNGAVCANAMTEVHSGGDSFKMRTIASSSEKGYVLNGSKIFVTNGPIARYFVVYALTNPDLGFFGGVSCFLLDRDVHSLVCGPPIAKSSLRNSPMCEVFFTDCFVGEEYLIGKIGAGAMLFLESMDWERACIAAMHAGTMRRLCSLATNYVQTRYRSEKLLSTFQAVQFKIAEIDVMSEASFVMALKAACLTDKGKGTVAAAQAKILASEYLLESAKLATELHGANGVVANSVLTDIMTDAQAALIYSGPNDVLRDLIASRL